LHLLADFLKSGELARHNAFVNRELGKKCKLLCAKLRDVGITDFYEPKGGYFVWAQSKGKMTGKGGEACTINKDK
jgi:DNA-binding transcriptional MocR family regulator